MGEIITVFGINWKLLVIQMVNFGVLLLVLYRFLYKPLLRVIEERREKIAQGLQDAARAEKKAKEIEDEKAGIIKQSLTEGENIVREAKQKAQNQEKALMHAAHEKETRVIAEARRAAQDERARVLAETREEIAQLAVLGAEKVLREQNKTA